MADKLLLSEMSPEEQRKVFAERAAASKARLAKGENLTGTQKIEEQQALDKAGEAFNKQVAAHSSDKPKIPESIITQRARPGGEAQAQMKKMYGEGLQTIPRSIADTPPVAEPSKQATTEQNQAKTPKVPENAFARFKKILGGK